MAGGANPTKAILYAFLANLGIAIAKTIAAVMTGSSAMVAEAIHSAADTGNQVLLYVGLVRSKKAPTKQHPLGFGKATFFWSFIVALVLFSLGGVYSLYEGLHKLENHEPIEQAWVAITVLSIGILLEGGSLFGCVKVINQLRGERGLWQWLKRSRSAELVVVFGEDVGALLGLVIALFFVCLAAVTGDGRYDAYGTIAIGAILLVIAIFVGIRIHALLIGSSADPEVVQAIEEHIAGDGPIEEVFNVITLQLGPDVMVATKVRIRAGLSVEEGCRAINALERSLKARFPEIRWSFVEPDITD